LLGGAYISLEPGGSPDMLAANGEITNTQGSVDLLTLLASAVGGAAGGASQEPSSTPETKNP
jgi:phospholipid/cholesterol/gamma-HCH transport system substrate-binding protein